MSLISLLLPRNAIATSEDLAKLLRRGAETDSGAFVTADSAMQVAAVYACVRVISETTAQVPLIVYRRTAEGRQRAVDHWAYRLLHEAPNAWQTPFEWKEMIQAHVALGGMGYSLKTVVGTEVRELLPIIPTRVKPQQDWLTKRTWFDITMPDGSLLPVPYERMFYVPGLAFNGLVGLSPIAYQREVIGLGMQLKKHEARLFKHGAQFTGVLEHPTLMDDAAYRRLIESFDEQYSGVENWHKTILLEEGVKFSKSGMSSKDAQFLELMKYTRTEIASIFRVAPHLIGDLERATHSNIEQQSLEHVQFTMAPWFTRIEQRAMKHLLPAADRATHYIEFLVDALLRGDQKSRYEAWHWALTDGWMNRNEVRERENMNRAEGLDEYRIASNTEPAGTTATDVDPPPVPPATPDDEEDGNA
jgi:HK97 family phage portal protein